MTTKEYLESIRILTAEIERLTERMSELDARATNISPKTGDGRGGSRTGGASFESAVIEITEVKERIADLTRQRDDALANARKMIAKIPSANMRKAVHARYIQCLSWNEIARRMSTSYQRARRLCRSGIERIEKK